MHKQHIRTEVLLMHLNQWSLFIVCISLNSDNEAVKQTLTERKHNMKTVNETTIMDMNLETLTIVAGGRREMTEEELMEYLESMPLIYISPLG